MITRWGKTALKKIESNPKVLWGVVLIACFTIYSFFYVPHVIMPQQGWWQYYASRVLQGDVLYKDIYLYMPPYYVFFVCLFYPLFKYHFFLYTVVVGYPIKVLCLLIMYRIMRKMVQPMYAAACVFAGAIISSAFLMDAWFDYNPILNFVCVVLAYFIMKYYENRAQLKKRLVTAFVVGILCSILLMSKQTLGIAFTALAVIMLIILHIKERIPKIFLSFASAALGYIVGLLPAGIYFIYNDCWDDFLHCLNIATGAKGGFGGLVNHFIAVLSYKSMWVIAIAVFALIVVAELGRWKVQDSGKQRVADLIRFLLICCVVLCACHVFYPYFSDLLGVIRDFRLQLYVLAVALCGFFWIRMEKKRKLLSTQQKVAVGVVVLLVGMVFCSRLSGTTLQSLYDGLDLFDMRRNLIVLMCYLFILFWLKELFQYFVQKSQSEYSLLMFWTVIAMHFFVGIVSAAVLEEISMIFYIPFSLALLFKCNCSGAKIKNGIILGSIGLMAIFCLICKLYIPYDWQGWRVTPISSQDVYCEVDGLEGLKVSRETNDAYSEIVDLILEETDADEPVYSFANIALFNVLTERESPTYAPIAWFDVCPDSVAEADAELLTENPPKIIVWQNMSDSEWDFLETVFRNGEPSGQRALKEFYDIVVKNNYTMEIEVDNHRDGTLQVWKRNDHYVSQDELSQMFGGGTGTLEDPFIVDTVDQLEQVRDLVNQGYSFENQYIAQTSDLDLSGIMNWEPIGKYNSEHQFQGTYDGRGHVIENLSCSANNNVGLFGCLGGTVCNLGIVNGYVKGHCVGVISSHAYSNSAQIINCYTICTVEGQRAGGIADNFSGNIINCISYSQCIGEVAAGAVSYQSGYIQNVWADKALVSSGIPNTYGHSSVTYADDDYLTSQEMRKQMNNQIAQLDFELDLVEWVFSEDGYLVLDSSAG